MIPGEYVGSSVNSLYAGDQFAREVWGTPVLYPACPEHLLARTKTLHPLRTFFKVYEQPGTVASAMMQTGGLENETR